MTIQIDVVDIDDNANDNNDDVRGFAPTVTSTAGFVPPVEEVKS